MATIPGGQGAVGVPAQYTETLTAPYGGIYLGSTPLPVLTDDIVVAASQTIPAFTPVGLDGSGRLIPAVSGVTQAIGVSVTDIVTDGTTNYKGLPIIRAGALNFDKINWPASYDTDAKKFAAFRGAPAPTNIVVKRVGVGVVY